MEIDIVFVEWQAYLMRAWYELHVKNIQLIYCYTSDTAGLQAWWIICIQVTSWKQDRISLHMTPYPQIIQTPRRDGIHLPYPQHTEAIHQYMCWHEICVLMGYYEAYSGNSSPKFRDNLSGPIFKVRWNICFSETSVKNYQPTLRSIREESRSDLLHMCWHLWTDFWSN
jgi:hypothetical protein